ncbi:acyl-CoA carboxylase subunit epsilon [Gulosibacter sp. 10]|uniref:acyl-CoA carboxylase subunit epsilon n=1 Tax=Gulosibacter sp. 10 TaxID=1255570 RepID=UPI00097EA839|nr:acyl-CoA carboxylase subunit epsilon [Gulosibacter sp. 10]SJM48023.1 hypothetical protein FM112_00395 [Gulosibacter sp. 10]
MVKQPRIAIPDLDLSDSLEPGEAALVRGNPSAEELAAVSATLAVLFAEGVAVDRPRDVPERLDPWERSQRFLQGGMSASDPLFGRFR